MKVKEKFLLIIETCLKNIDNYKPSFFLMDFVYREMFIDDLIGFHYQKEIVAYLTIVKKELEVWDLDEEIKDINPQPIFYIDTDSIRNCFDFIEVAYITFQRAKIFSDLLKLEFKNIN